MSKRGRSKRGRKAGDGILKLLQPGQTFAEKAIRLTYGYTGGIGDPAYEMVRHWHFIQHANNNLPGLRDARKDASERIAEAMWSAFVSNGAEFLKRVAQAMDVEKERDRKPAYPLHMGILLLALACCVAPDDPRTPENWPRLWEAFRTKRPEDVESRYTIGQVCAALAAHRTNQSEEVWTNTVRRACKEVGIPLAKSKPGPKESLLILRAIARRRKSR
ncbi:MAG TPA: hypothetical protein VG167_20205 [Verrucomicrobiae bacterium]|nr:hypothetical protein [Verrucomicrobiae bacterium]